MTGPAGITGPGTTGPGATGAGATGAGVRDALDAFEVEALVTDRYLEGLLAAAERRAADAPSDAALDPALRRTALRLHDELVRVHPSFRFEERLARRLAEAAAAMRPAAAAGGRSVPVPFARPLFADPAVPSDPAPGTHPYPGTHPALVAGPAASASRAAGVPRPLLVGGAVTSAALSVAGAAVVAWLLSRGQDDAMTRAVRVARAARAGRAVLPRGLA